MKMPSKQAGFTLVELMIAIGLMLLIMLQLNIIFNQSRKMFIAANAMVEVYQNARSALDLMERDISNIRKTHQMEFFHDLPADYGNGMYNEDLTFNGMKEALSGPAPTGIDPRFFPGVPYIYAMCMKEDKYHPEIKNAKWGGPYRADSLYFKTMTVVEGKPHEALALWELYYGDQGPSKPRERPILRRTLWDVERVKADGTPEVKKHDATDVCYYVEEFKTELFLRDKRTSGVGRFYSPSEAVFGAPKINQETGTHDALEQPNLHRWASGSELYGIMCVTRNEAGANALAPAKLRTVDAVLQVSGSTLPMLAAGDEMYIQSRVADPGNPKVMQDFKGPVTISKINVDKAGTTTVEFDQAPFMILKMQPYFKANMADITVDWRAGWLPSALRVTMKVKDSRSLEVRTIQRIFQILRS